MSPDLNAIQERADRATPGPWSWRGNNDEDPRLEGGRRHSVLAVIRRERQAADPETKSYEDYVRDWETPYVDADGDTKYRPLTEEEVAEHVKKDWLQDPWGGPQYDNRLAFRDHGTNIMQYARDIAGLNHPDAEFVAHAREDVPALLEALHHELTRVEMMTYQRGAVLAAVHSMQLGNHTVADVAARVEEIFSAGMTAEIKRGYEDELARYAERLEQLSAELHDRPTVWAYQQACKTIERMRPVEVLWSNRPLGTQPSLFDHALGRDVTGRCGDVPETDHPTGNFIDQDREPT